MSLHYAIYGKTIHQHAFSPRPLIAMVLPGVAVCPPASGLLACALRGEGTGSLWQDCDVSSRDIHRLLLLVLVKGERRIQSTAFAEQIDRVAPDRSTERYNWYITYLPCIAILREFFIDTVTLSVPPASSSLLSSKRNLSRFLPLGFFPGSKDRDLNFRVSFRGCWRENEIERRKQRDKNSC